MYLYNNQIRQKITYSSINYSENNLKEDTFFIQL